MSLVVVQVFLLLIPAALFAQTATLSGVITDESGAVVPAATVTLTGVSGEPYSAGTGAEGSYSIAGIAPGAYIVRVSAPGMALSEPRKITLKPGLHTLNLQLRVAALSEQITVEDTAGSTVTPEPANNASAIVLQGEDLQALSDDPTDLAEDLQALAGPAAGPNGGQIYVDGFSGGQLPSKDSIREIRVNQNPFSPEYDKLGYGRVEIFTKPGADKFRGSAFYNFGDDFWNSRNPYAAEKAPFLLKEYGGNVGGPISRRSSFFVDVRRDATDNSSIINAVTLDPATFAITPFTGFYVVPQRALRVSPRIDYQIDEKNTLTGRYAYSHMDIPGAGIGSFNLSSRGYDAATDTQTVQLTETAVLSSTVINEIRFQYFRTNTEDVPFTATPAIQVLESVNEGGAQIGHAFDTQNNYELQDYVSAVRGKHNLRFGGRFRSQVDDSIQPQNYGGTYTFGGGQGPELDSNNQPVIGSDGQPVVIAITSIEQYRRTRLFQQLGYSPEQIRALGGGASQFGITMGNPALTARQLDFSFFAGDDWRLRPNLTLSLGLRYEVQTNVHDWLDFAPRVGLAWAPGRRGKSGKTVVRAGFGIFYDRFSLTNAMTAERYNGIIQQQYVVPNPNFFPAIPPADVIAGAEVPQVIERVSPSLRAPYIMQSAAGIERQLPLNTTVAVTYANSHGLHMLRSRDINAPLPGTYDPNNPDRGVYPFGRPGAVFQMESAGLYNQNQVIVNVNSKLNANVSLFTSYMWNQALSNTDGINTFPANQYDMSGEYGPAATDVRNRLSFGGSLNTRWDIRLSPFVIVESGPPFNITAGQDLYGTTLFNARPGIATDPSKPGLVETEYGLLDPTPGPGEEILTRNYGRGPGQVMVNLRFSKTIGFGKVRENPASVAPQPASDPRRGGGGPFSTGGGLGSIFSTPSTSKPYNLIISMAVRNILNHNNPGPIIGNIASPIFGQANQPAGARDLGGGGFSEAANNRRLELQVRFTF